MDESAFSLLRLRQKRLSESKADGDVSFCKSPLKIGFHERTCNAASTYHVEGIMENGTRRKIWLRHKAAIAFKAHFVFKAKH